MSPEPAVQLRAAILGTVLIAGPGPADLVEPAGPRGKTLVAALALAPGSAVSARQLTDDVWGDDPPRDPRAALQTLVSRLRRGVAPGLIESTSGGYLLRARADETDLGLADLLLGQARRALARGQADEATTLVTSALELWRGEPGADLCETEVRTVLAHRWAAVRSSLYATRAEARILRGDGEEALRDLDVVDDGGRPDEFWVDLRMRALDAAGFRNEALHVYARFRRFVRGSLGTEPSRELVDLNARLLSDDPSHPASRSVIGLRSAPNELLGRAADVAAVNDLLREGRLVTILGPGGLGKTRLAQEVARAASEHLPAVIFVELAGVGTGEDLTLVLASTLGIREASARLTSDELPVRVDVRERILGLLAERETLLIMDNCEHLLDSAARWIADILAATSQLRVLATSRSPLSINAEGVYPLRPLGLSEDGAAVDLFIVRARAARPGAVLPRQDVSRLCIRLDGLPLAIELAAARVRSMSVEEIERRLTNRFALLTVGERTAPQRHRTLTAVIEWSWNLLSPSEQRLLRRVSRFPGGFSPEAAQAVGGFDTGDDMGDDLDGLVAQSMVAVVEDGPAGLLRYRMLETVREFGALALDEAGEGAAVELALRGWGVGYAHSMLATLAGSPDLRAMADFASEQENLVAILRRALGQKDAPAALSLFAALGYYWIMCGAHSDLISFGAMVARASVGYRPTPDTRDDAVLSYVLAAGNQPFGDNRSGLLALALLRRTLRDGSSSHPQIAAVAELVMAAINGMEDVHRALDVFAHSHEPTVEIIAQLLTAQLAENAGELQKALTAARRAHHLAVGQRHVWFQATTAQALAELHAEMGDPHGALEWIGMTREGQMTLQSRPDLDQLNWLEALMWLADGRRGGATRVFEDLLSEGAPQDGPDQRRGMGYTGLAEAALAEANIPMGLRLYREAAGRANRPLDHPWLRIATAAAVAAHVVVGDPEPEFTRPRVHRLRGTTLAGHRLQPEGMDLPVTGCALLAIGLWLLRPIPTTGPRTLADALELVQLAGALGVRQTLPALNLAATLAPLESSQGAEPVKAARRRVEGLSPRTALERSIQILLGEPVRRALQGGQTP